MARSTATSRTAPSLPRRAGRRKIVLATSIAETSITIEGVRIVVDSGLARVPRYEPDVGVTRLETVRVSRAAADQRRGRAGRTEPGVCYRLWDEPQTAALEPFARPEILAADLSSFALDLAAWGARAGHSSPSSIRRRAPRSPKRRRCCASLAPSTPTAASPRKARSCAGCRCRRGLRAWWSTRRPKATRALAAEIAALIGERGLGGDDVDFARASMRCIATARRAREEARAMAARWADFAAPRCRSSRR